MSQEPLEAAPSRRALRARQADAAPADAPESVVADGAVPRPSRRELRAMERSVEADPFGAPDLPAETPTWAEPTDAPAVGLSGRAASLWSEPAEQWAGRAEEWVEQTGSWAVQPAPAAWSEDVQPAWSGEAQPAWSDDAQPAWSQDAQPAWSDDSQPTWSDDAQPAWSDDAEPAWSIPGLEPEQWTAPEPARAELWADRADQWSVPEPAQAEPWQQPEPVAQEEPVESGSLIMPAGHLNTGPVTPAQPYGRPAVFLDAPVQPALPPIDLELEPEPVRARVGVAEPARVPGPRGPRQAPVADEVALRALALAEASPSVVTALAAGTSAREVELADPLGELTLAERLASLPVAPWAVDLEVIEGGYVEHPCEPVDSVPQPHEPVADRVPPATAAPERPRDLSTGSSRPSQARAAGTAAGTTRSAPTTEPAPRRPAVPDARATASTTSFRPEAATHRVADSTLRPPAERGASAEHPLPRANEHIPTVAAWVPPDHSVDPLTAMRRKPGPPLATWGAWLGVAAAVAWFVGPIALGIGVWAMNVAREHDYSRARPLTAIVGGAIGTLMGIAFIVAWR